MADGQRNDGSNQSGHIGRGSVVTTEDRPPGPVPLQRMRRLGDNYAGFNNPHGEGPVSTAVRIANNGGKTY